MSKLLCDWCGDNILNKPKGGHIEFHPNRKGETPHQWEKGELIFTQSRYFCDLDCFDNWKDLDD